MMGQDKEPFADQCLHVVLHLASLVEAGQTKEAQSYLCSHINVIVERACKTVALHGTADYREKLLRPMVESLDWALCHAGIDEGSTTGEREDFDDERDSAWRNLVKAKNLIGGPEPSPTPETDRTQRFDNYISNAKTIVEQVRTDFEHRNFHYAESFRLIQNLASEKPRRTPQR